MMIKSRTQTNDYYIEFCRQVCLKGVVGEFDLT